MNLRERLKSLLRNTYSDSMLNEFVNHAKVRAASPERLEMVRQHALEQALGKISSTLDAAVADELRIICA